MKSSKHVETCFVRANNDFDDKLTAFWMKIIFGQKSQKTDTVWPLWEFGRGSFSPLVFFLLHRLAGTLKYSLVLYWGWTVHQSNLAGGVSIGIHLVQMFPKYQIHSMKASKWIRENQTNLALSVSELQWFLKKTLNSRDYCCLFRKKCKCNDSGPKWQ